MHNMEVLSLLDEAISSLDDEEREALVRLIRRVAQNADEIGRALDCVLAMVDLAEESKPVFKELYAELGSLLSLAEDVDFSEVIEQIKAYLEDVEYPKK